MRIAKIGVQNYPLKNGQNSRNTNYSTPIPIQNNYDLYFKSLELSSNANKAVTNSSKNIAFSSTALVKASGETATVARSVIHSSAKLLQETVLPAIEAKAGEVKALGHFGSVDSVKALLQGAKPEVAEKLAAFETAGEGNQAKVAQLYHEFATNHLPTLADESGSKSYTGFWAKNKKLGRKSLVNFWLETAGINPRGKTPAQKAEILKGLDPAAKQSLASATVEHWVEKILSKDLDRLRKKDINHLEAAAKEHPFVKVEAEDVKTKMLSMIETDGVEQFEAMQHGDKNLLDFWIDSIDGEGVSKDFSAAQKKRRLVEILDSPDDLARLRQQTLEEVGKTSEQIKRTQSAYQNLIEESELDQASQELLQRYQDNQLFFQVVTSGAKNKTSVSNLEVSTKKLLEELAQEQTIALQQGRTNLFQPLRDMHYLSADAGNDNMAQSRAQALASILGSKIKLATPKEVEQIGGNIKLMQEAERVIPTVNGRRISSDVEARWEEWGGSLGSSESADYIYNGLISDLNRNYYYEQLEGNAPYQELCKNKKIALEAWRERRNTIRLAGGVPSYRDKDALWEEAESIENEKVEFRKQTLGTKILELRDKFHDLMKPSGFQEGIAPSDEEILSTWQTLRAEIKKLPKQSAQLDKQMDDFEKKFFLIAQDVPIKPVDNAGAVGNIDLKGLWPELEDGIESARKHYKSRHFATRTGKNRLSRKIDDAERKLNGAKRTSQDTSAQDNVLEKARERYQEYLRRGTLAEGLPELVVEFKTLLNDNNANLLPPWERLKTQVATMLQNGYGQHTYHLETDSLYQKMEAFERIMIQKKEVPKPQPIDIVPQWLQLIDTAQRHFEGVQVGEALDKGMNQRRTAQRALALKPAAEIQQALEAKTLTPVQKDLVARYADNPHLKNLLAQPAGKYNDDISSLVATEQLNLNIFDSASAAFRNNLSQETVNQMPEFADSYIRTLGFDSTRLSAEEKYQLLAKVPSEELKLVSHAVRNHFEENFLTPTMSDVIQNKVRALDPGYNTSLTVQRLDQVSVQLDGQQRTLNEISGSIDHFIDVYQETSARMIGVLEDGFGDLSGRLDGMARTLDGIHADTSNIRNNIKVGLYRSIQSTKDKALRTEMQGLLDDAGRMELSAFIRSVETRHNQSEGRVKKFYGLFANSWLSKGLLIAGGTAVDMFAPGLGTLLTAHGMNKIGHLVSDNLGHAVNTAIQCSDPKVGFFTSLLTGTRMGDTGWTPKKSS